MGTEQADITRDRVELRTVRSGALEIATQSFGRAGDPPVLLIMGAMASMLWWPEDFCEDLARAGRFVIRYDNRDTGLSTCFPPGEASYTLGDMGDDAVAVLDGYGLSTAHLVGMSLGGLIAQRATLDHPSRVATLTAISTTPLGAEGLPPMRDDYAAHADAGETVDWSDRASVRDYLVRDARMLAGTAHPHDPDAARRLIERDLERARSFASVTNHFSLFERELGGGTAAELAPPLLVIHGGHDPIFPIEHGEALAGSVPGATLLRIEGGGHELHPADRDRMVAAIVAHTA